MKKMMTVMMISSALFASASLVQAEDYRSQKGYKHSPEERVDRMAYRLKLTDEQKQNILTVMQQERDVMEKMREQNRLAVASYLNDDQKQAFEQMQSRRNQCRSGDRERDDD